MPTAHPLREASGVVGRFAPTPSGPLHFGSLLAALASWLDARARGGRWLLRLEDIDPPRCPPGASDTIRAQLEAFGLEHDGEIRFQRDQGELYRLTLERLIELGLAYPCSCSRKAWQSHTVYPGWCREGPRHPERDCAWRLRTDLGPDTLVWQDRRLGEQRWLLAPLGDVVLKRRDGLWAYQLAVVADDADQGVTDVVRGVDLVDNTPWQLHIQKALGFSEPHYLHLPLALAENGQKLSKQNLAEALPVHESAVRALLDEALGLLGQKRPGPFTPVREQLAAAVLNWDVARLPQGNLRRSC